MFKKLLFLLFIVFEFLKNSAECMTPLKEGLKKVQKSFKNGAVATNKPDTPNMKLFNFFILRVGPIDITYSTGKLCLYIFLISFFLIVLIMVIAAPFYFHYLSARGKAIKNDGFKFDESKISFKIQHYLLRFVEFFRSNYEKMLTSFYTPIINKFMDNSPVIWHDLLSIILSYYYYIKIFLIIFYFLPPCIISFTYLVEVAYFRSFTYFPYMIFLMVFPLGIRVFLYHAEQYCEKVQELLNAVLILVKEEDNDQTYVWSDELDENFRTPEDFSLFVYSAKKNKALIRLFKGVRYHIYTSYTRIFLNIFSITCWLSSFSFLLYLIISNK